MHKHSHTATSRGLSPPGWFPGPQSARPWGVESSFPSARFSRGKLPVAAPVTKHHKLGRFKQIYCHTVLDVRGPQKGSQWDKIKMSAGLPSFRRLERRFFPGCFQLLEAACMPSLWSPSIFRARAQHLNLSDPCFRHPISFSDSSAVSPSYESLCHYTGTTR